MATKHKHKGKQKLQTEVSKKAGNVKRLAETSLVLTLNWQSSFQPFNRAPAPMNPLSPSVEHELMFLLPEQIRDTQKFLHPILRLYIPGIKFKD